MILGLIFFVNKNKSNQFFKNALGTSINFYNYILYLPFLGFFFNQYNDDINYSNDFIKTIILGLTTVNTLLLIITNQVVVLLFINYSLKLKDYLSRIPDIYNNLNILLLTFIMFV